MIQNGVEMVVLVKNKPVTEYSHDNKMFIEGRAGSNYEIEIRNRAGVRLEAVISVDGLSVLNGEPAGLESRGYLLLPGEAIRIPGWRLDGLSAAKFAFAGKQESYGTHVAGGDSSNNGVIGVMAFAEQARPIQMWNGLAPTIGASLRGINISASHSATTQPASGMYNYTTNASNPIGGRAQWAASETSYASAAPIQQTLGTGFGEATAFATREVSFTRGNIFVMMSVFYDNLKGLRARGVPVERVRKPRVQAQPQAFPGLQGCKPPPNWQG